MKCYSPWRRSTNFVKNENEYAPGEGTYQDPFEAYAQEQIRISKTYGEGEEATRTLDQYQKDQAPETQRVENRRRAKLARFQLNQRLKAAAAAAQKAARKAAGPGAAGAYRGS